VRVVIAEDQALLREGLALVLSDAGYEVAAAASDAPGLLGAVETLKPELVVTDIRMPPTWHDEGLLAALQIRRDHPNTAVLVLSQFVHRRYAVELVQSTSGGIGYLLKQRISDINTFRTQLKMICEGGTVLDAEVVERLLSRAGDHMVDQLTPRQQEVLALMAAGHSNAAIARRLFVSEKAVIQHVSHIYDLLTLPPSADEHRRVLAVVGYLTEDRDV